MKYLVSVFALLFVSSFAVAATGAPAATFGSGYELFAGTALLGAVGLKKVASLIDRNKNSK